MVSIAFQFATMEQFDPIMAQFVAGMSNLPHHCNILWRVKHVGAKDVEDWLVATEGDYDARVTRTDRRARVDALEECGRGVRYNKDSEKKRTGEMRDSPASGCRTCAFCGTACCGSCAA